MLSQNVRLGKMVQVIIARLNGNYSLKYFNNNDFSCPNTRPLNNPILNAFQRLKYHKKIK